MHVMSVSELCPAITTSQVCEKRRRKILQIKFLKKFFISKKKTIFSLWMNLAPLFERMALLLMENWDLWRKKQNSKEKKNYLFLCWKFKKMNKKIFTLLTILKISRKKNCTIYRSEVPLFSMKHDHFFLFYPELRNRVYKKNHQNFLSSNVLVPQALQKILKKYLLLLLIMSESKNKKKYLWVYLNILASLC